MRRERKGSTRAAAVFADPREAAAAAIVVWTPNLVQPIATYTVIECCIVGRKGKERKGNEMESARV